MTTIITKAQAAAKVAFFLDATEKVANGQQVRHGERSLTRADAGWISEQLKYWSNLYDQLSAAEDSKNRRVRYMDWNNV